MPPSCFDLPSFNESLFFPRKDWTPASEGAEDRFVAVPDALLHVRWHRAAAARLTLLLFHGNGSVACDFDAWAPMVADCGAALAVADYRGYGASTGVPTLRRALEDAPKIAQALLDAGAAPMVVHGQSLGSACAAELGQDPLPGLGGIVWDSGFFDLGGLVARRGMAVPKTFPKEDLERFDPRPKLARCTLPALVLHGAEDRQIPPEEARAAWATLPGAAKRLVLLEGCGHDDTPSRLEYWQALSDFLGELDLPRQAP